MQPQLLIHNSFIIFYGGSVTRRQEEAIVSAGNHLTLTLGDAPKLQFVPRLLIVLGHGEICNLLHVGIVDVLDGGPTADNSGGSHGGERKEEKGQDNKVVSFHGCL
ncbi:unnamed protein product [Lupinus luteus]|uniref:Uncharacterized protein n=1 Tax=Lupinus luteus TaxID=3873 RepID=A0AAV1VWD0_LUPLU